MQRDAELLLNWNRVVNMEAINEWQEAVSKVCRITDGIPQRVDRLRALGNAVVPIQAKEAFKILMGLK